MNQIIYRVVGPVLEEVVVEVGHHEEGGLGRLRPEVSPRVAEHRLQVLVGRQPLHDALYTDGQKRWDLGCVNSSRAARKMRNHATYARLFDYPSLQRLHVVPREDPADPVDEAEPEGHLGDPPTGIAQL